MGGSIDSDKASQFIVVCKSVELLNPGELQAFPMTLLENLRVSACVSPGGANSATRPSAGRTDVCSPQYTQSASFVRWKSVLPGSHSLQRRCESPARRLSRPVVDLFGRKCVWQYVRYRTDYA